MTERIFTRGIAIPAHRPKSFDDTRNSVRVVAVTENPVSVWDWERKSSIDEILLIDGAHLPPNGQIPLLDSHNRSSVTSVLGSARNFTPNGNILECDVFFSSTEAGKNAALNVKEGHLTDFSVGYFPAESDYIPVGEEKNINGRQFKGPVKVTTKWNLRELSLTPIGADQNATARSQDSNTSAPAASVEEPSPQPSDSVKDTAPVPQPPQPVVSQTDENKQAEIKPDQSSGNSEPVPEPISEQSVKEDIKQTAIPEPAPQPEKITPAPVQPEKLDIAPAPSTSAEQPVEHEVQPEEQTRQVSPQPSEKTPAQPINIIDMIFYIFIGIMVLFLLKGLF